MQALAINSTQNQMSVEFLLPVHNTYDRPQDNDYTTWCQAETPSQSSDSVTVTTCTVPMLGTYSESHYLI